MSRDLSFISKIRKVDIYVEMFKRRNFDFIINSEKGVHVKQGLALNYLTDKETSYLIYGGAASGAKVVPDEGVVLTPFGFKKGNLLKEGDLVNNPDGSVAKIVRVHPRYEHPTWRVKFHDGTSTVVTGGHLWQAWRSGKVMKRKNKHCLGEESAEVVETETLLKWLEASRRQKAMGIRENYPLIPVAHEQPFNVTQKKRVDIDPYLLGFMIGDGCFRGKTPTFTTADHDHFRDQFACYDMIQDDERTYRFRGGSGSLIKAALQKLKLWSHKSETKFIPRQFKYSSIPERYAFVQGLMDADGTVDERGHVYFSTSSPELSEDMAFVLRSLGAVVTISQEPAGYKKDGEYIQCLDTYRLYIKHRKPTELFRLKRHQKRAASGKPDSMFKRVVDIEIDGTTFTGRCITVSNPNGLYLTDDFIVTHNSFTGGAWEMFMCLAYPGTRWFIGRNELKRLRQSTLPTINKVSKRYGILKGKDYTFNGSDNFFQFANGSRIDFLDLRYLPSDPLYERFGSIEYTGGWIEESGEVDFLAFDVLKSRIGRHLNTEYNLPKKMYVTLNPKKNWNYTRFYLPWKEGRMPKHEVFIQAFVTDNPFREVGYEDTLAEIEDVGLRERLLYGNWDYDDDPYALTDYDAQCDLFTNNFVRPDRDNRYLIADIALQGSDKFVIGIYYGLVCVERVSIPKSDGKKVVLTIDALKIKHKIPNSNIIYDADGIGGFVGGFVAGAVSFHGNAAPLFGENYENLKTQLYYMLAKYIMERRMWIAADLSERDMEEIKAEVAQIKSRSPDDDKKLKIIRKEEVKKNIGRSPDNTDMMMMRMYFEMKRPVQGGKQRQVKTF